ncbi:MAG: RNA polymerase sigma factor [Gammaproteobacteria bacterium]|nr:RNA polymerase sigma factor [Gammaproteobacteria bacterium]
MTKRCKPVAAKKIQQPSLIHCAYISNLAALKRFTLRLTGNFSDAEDVLQEAFLRAYLAEKSYTIEQPAAFLFRISRNVALDLLRRRTRTDSICLEAWAISELTHEISPESELEAYQQLALHCDAVALLPPACRKVYILRKVNDCSYKEIAAQLGISISTVESHLEKGFSRCNLYLKQLNGQMAAPKPALDLVAPG